MIRRSFFLISLILLILLILTAGCIKETYDLNRFSKKDHLSPTMALPVFIGDVAVSELGLDLDFRSPSLEIRKAVDNFLKMGDLNTDNPLKPENFDLVSLDFAVKNGIPLNVSIQMSLQDSVNKKVLSKVKVLGLLEAATVDNNGKVISFTESRSQVKLTKEFLSSIPKSDKIIFEFTFSTPNNGEDYVSLKSDFSISFKAAVIFKPDMDL